MPAKKKILERLEKEEGKIEKEGAELDEFEHLTGKELDATQAPGIAVEEKLKKKWKHEETEQEIEEPGEVLDEGMNIEKEEEAGEEPK